MSASPRLSLFAHTAAPVDCETLLSLSTSTLVSTEPPLLVPSPVHPGQYVASPPAQFPSPTHYASALKWYGQQILRPPPNVSTALQGQLDVSDVLRRLQLCRLATTGVIGTGEEIGYGQNAQGTARVARQAEQGLLGGKWKDEGDLECRIVLRPMPIKPALFLAAQLCARIRQAQRLQDGNHRTSLSTFILSLAQSHILIKPKFDFLRAYLLISARYHPSHQDNSISDEGAATAARRLAQYSRKRVEPGLADLQYFERMMGKVRRVVLDHSVVQDVYQEVSRVRGLEERIKRWKGVDEAVRRYIGISYSGFPRR